MGKNVANTIAVEVSKSEAFAIDAFMSCAMKRNGTLRIVLVKTETNVPLTIAIVASPR